MHSLKNAELAQVVVIISADELRNKFEFRAILYDIIGNLFHFVRLKQGKSCICDEEISRIIAILTANDSSGNDFYEPFKRAYFDQLEQCFWSKLAESPSALMSVNQVGDLFLVNKLLFKRLRDTRTIRTTCEHVND